MPIPRYSSSSALNQGREGGRAGSERDNGSMYSSDRNSGLYRSSPDLAHSSLSNRRSSSTDSTDGSHGGGHSRQSSDSLEYPTRRYSTQSSSSRKTSVSDPLQFIKVKGAMDMASTAQEQIKLSAETKKMKITESISEDDSTDWVNNLASWKNRRKSHSEKSYQLKEELEQMERDKEEPKVTASQSTKTFSQMQEERERRKSAGLKHFYPIEDEGEDDIFSPSPSEVKHSSPASRSSSRFQSSTTSKEDVKDTKVRSRTKEDVAKWAQDLASEDKEEGGHHKDTNNSHQTSAPMVETRTSRFSRDMENNTSTVGTRTSRFSRDMENNTSTVESRASRFSRDVENYSSPSESRASRFSRDMENSSSTIESRASRFSRDMENNSSASESRASRFSHDTENSAPRQRRSGVPDHYTQEKDSRQRQHSEAGRDGALKENNRSSANSSLSSRSSGKVSNILKSFQQKEEEEAKPKASVNSSVSAGRRSFEQGVGRSADNGATVSHSVGDSYRAWSNDKDKGSGKGSSRTEMTSQSSSMVYTSNRNSGKDYVEKTIKISQKPNSDKGFGFTLSGGADKKQPVVVEKVGLGSAADVCELQAKDEVVTINGQSVARLTSVELTHKVKDAVRAGQIELRVKRFLGSADDLEDEEDFLSTDEDVDTPDRSISKSSSIRAENSFDSLDSRDGQQKTEDEPERPWIEEHIPPTVKAQSNRRGDPTSTSSDSGYDAQTFYHRGDNSSNEEELAPSQQQQTESQARPSLAARTRHLYPRDEDEDDYVNLRVPETTTSSCQQHQYSDRGMGKEVAPPGDVQVESRPTITVRRQRVEVLQTKAEEDDSKPGASSEFRGTVTASRREERHSEQTASEDSDSGPPAALRKWQRQRPRAEYTFESDEQPPQFYDQMKMSSSRHGDNPTDDAPQEDTYYKSSEDTDDTLNNTVPAVSSRRAFRTGEDKQRIRSWNQKQEEERQPDDAPPPGHSEIPVHSSSPYQQQRVTAERAQIQQQYQDDLQQAAHTERQKQQQEKQLLEPEMEKMRVLEERRAQRQARLQMYAQNLDADFAPPASSSRSAAPPMEAAYDEGAVLSQQQQQHTSTFTTQVNNSQTSGAGQPEVLIIDPRNRGEAGREPVEISQQGQSVQFQVKINSRETPQGLLIQPEVIPAHHAAPPPPTDHAAFLEAERERIRQEELQKIEAERLRREEEERKHLREKEEQLRQQEEMLRQQQEELRKTQERLEQERQQLQHQQHKPPQADYQSSSGTTRDGLQFETVTSKVRGSSPVYTSTIVAGPRRSEGHPHTSQSYPDRNQDGYGVRRSEPSWNSSRPQTASSWRGNVQTVTSSHSQLPKWPPAGEEQRHADTLPSQGAGQYSRDDMVAMNRKATPLQAKPPSPSPVSITAGPPDAVSPGKREVPSKTQIHSLNSVPRAKFRHSDQWMAEEPSHSVGGEGRPPPDAARRSEAYRSQFAGPQDHWLVQEAERRRLNDGSHGQGPTRAQFSGPIKPVTDNYGNRWREGGGEVRRSPNMPAQLRQTLLQKTAGARGSTASMSSQEVNPPGPAPYQGDPAAGLSHTLPPTYGYGSGYSPSSRSDPLPPQHPAPSSHGGGRDTSANVSGKQRCSHCNQELGFGAAMVIESLGLYYHTQCFRCCVCRTPLGSGVEGADVRVRVNKLHCPNCYSNDEGHATRCAGWDEIWIEVQ